jgi:hypothetical protein
MEKEEQLLKEYQNLRDEIRGADSLNYQILGIVVGAVAAILTTGFTQTDASIRLLIFLCIYVVTLPGYRLLKGNRRRVWRISTYMRVFLEPELKFMRWETRLDQQRRKILDEAERQFFSSLVGTNEWIIVSMLNLIAGLMSIFYGLFQANIAILNIPIDGVRMGGTILLILFNIWLALSMSKQEKDLRRLGKIEQSYLQSWVELKNTSSKQSKAG